MNILWVLVNCNSAEEAERIGDRALTTHLAACFHIFPRALTRYFWPPKSGTVEQGAGALLVLETLPKHFRELEQLVTELHSDELPFIGSLDIANVRSEYANWLSGELKE